MKYALILNGIVQTIIIWDGIAEWSPPPESLLILLNENEECAPCYIYVPSSFPRFVFAECPEY